jgi:hypothetical protein
MINRRNFLQAFGASGVLLASGCAGSNNSSGRGTIELRDQFFEDGVSEVTRRRNDFTVEVPEDSWAQIHLDLTQYATLIFVARAKAGSGTIFIMPRDEWQNYISPETDWRGLSLAVDNDGVDTQSESASTVRNSRFSIAAENFESGGIFEATFVAAEEVDRRNSYRQNIVVEAPDTSN